LVGISYYVRGGAPGSYGLGRQYIGPGQEPGPEPEAVLTARRSKDTVTGFGHSVTGPRHLVVDYSGPSYRYLAKGSSYSTAYISYYARGGVLGSYGPSRRYPEPELEPGPEPVPTTGRSRYTVIGYRALGRSRLLRS